MDLNSLKNRIKVISVFYNLCPFEGTIVIEIKLRSIFYFYYFMKKVRRCAQVKKGGILLLRRQYVTCDQLYKKILNKTKSTIVNF